MGSKSLSDNWVQSVIDAQQMVKMMDRSGRFQVGRKVLILERSKETEEQAVCFCAP
jgi:hypothetical protein